MEEKRKQLKLVKDARKKRIVGLLPKVPAIGITLAIYTSPLTLGTYLEGEHIFKRDYNTEYAYQETVDTFDKEHTTTSKFNYEGYESIIGEGKELPKSYITEYAEWKELGNGEYARTIKYYDISSTDYDKAIKLLTGVCTNKEMNIEEYFKTPVLEDVEISKTKTDTTKYKLTYYSIDEENTIVKKETYGEQFLEISLLLLATIFLGFISTYGYIILMALAEAEPKLLMMFDDVIYTLQEIQRDNKQIKELKKEEKQYIKK